LRVLRIFNVLSLADNEVTTIQINGTTDIIAPMDKIILEKI